MELRDKILHGWEISAEGFSKEIVAPEFESPGREVWQALILEKAPYEGKLRILDVGTGPGLFAVILSLAGHDVTGIDISPAMLEQARCNASRYAVSPEFLQMDSQTLTFPDDSFDMIVSRNVMWIMEKPEEAYFNWLRCLKPGGIVIVFDGGHPAQDRDVPAPRDDAHRKEEYFKKFGEYPPISYKNYEIARGWRKELKLTYEARPEWDIEEMKRQGYIQISCEDVSERAYYNEKLQFLRKGTVFFRLCGVKRVV